MKATWIDAAGVLGAIFAALCCAGLPVIVSVLAAIGVGWLRRDAIVWPLMILSLAIALWGLNAQRRMHGANGPLVLATIWNIRERMRPAAMAPVVAR